MIAHSHASPDTAPIDCAQLRLDALRLGAPGLLSMHHMFDEWLQSVLKTPAPRMLSAANRDELRRRNARTAASCAT